jgi:uncharacterized protein
MGAVQRLVQRARQVSGGAGADVPSPCVSVCRMDAHTQWCEGCFRTLAEIAAWSRMDDAGKREVWRMIGERALTKPAAPSSRDSLAPALAQTVRVEDT